MTSQKWKQAVIVAGICAALAGGNAQAAGQGPTLKIDAKCAGAEVPAGWICLGSFLGDGRPFGVGKDSLQKIAALEARGVDYIGSIRDERSRASFLKARANGRVVAEGTNGALLDKNASFVLAKSPKGWSLVAKPVAEGLTPTAWSFHFGGAINSIFLMAGTKETGEPDVHEAAEAWKRWNARS